MKNLCQRVSVTDSIHPTAKITPLLFVPDIHRWTVVRTNLTSMTSFAMVAQKHTKIRRQNLFRKKSRRRRRR